MTTKNQSSISLFDRLLSEPGVIGREYASNFLALGARATLIEKRALLSAGNRR